MKFHCLLPVRDEADIIGQCLEHLLRWADNIYIFDTGSIDGTWEIAGEAASKDPRIHLLKREEVFYAETKVRGWIFNQARKNMRNGDWFLRVDADEFHHITPPEFVRTRMRPGETIAWHQYYDFQLTESERLAWETGSESMVDRTRPIEERRRFYVPSVYSEPRLCRYRETMCWPANASFPYNAGFVARERLPIRHYPHRDPDQMKRRCLLRALMLADEKNRSDWTHPQQHHWSEREWLKFVTPDHSPQLRYWHPGTNLPALGFTTHLAAPAKRAIQRCIHPFFLPVLDRLRSSWKDSDHPQPIPQHMSLKLREELENAK